MAELRDAELRCPRCGAEMARGFINAGKGPVRWVTEPNENKTVIGGDRMAKQQLGVGPSCHPGSPMRVVPDRLLRLRPLGVVPPRSAVRCHRPHLSAWSWRPTTS